MKGFSLLFIIIIILAGSCNTLITSQIKIAVLTLDAGGLDRFETSVSVCLDDITYVHESELALFEIINDQRIPVDIQFSASDKRSMHWIVSGSTPGNNTRVYQLMKDKSVKTAPVASINRVDGKYEFQLADRKVITYHAATLYPENGIDTIFKRSGVIHPLYAPNGAILTRIQPPDHYHHYGIWNPWTKTKVMGKEVDFWNLAKQEGTVRNAGILSMNEGNVFSSAQFLHEHIAWPESGNERKVISEVLEIKVHYRTDNIFLIDIISRLDPHEPITLEEYRYGGFTFRGTESWNKDNSKIITSEDDNRDNLDGKRARWCLVSGDTPEGRTGLLIMGHPANFNHPEPLRVWPADANKGRGDIFINFSPTRNTDWELVPGNSYLLRYRILVFDGELEPDEAEKYWHNYVNPMLINWE